MDALRVYREKQVEFPGSGIGRGHSRTGGFRIVQRISRRRAGGAASRKTNPERKTPMAIKTRTPQTPIAMANLIDRFLGPSFG